MKKGIITAFVVGVLVMVITICIIGYRQNDKLVIQKEQETEIEQTLNTGVDDSNFCYIVIREENGIICFEVSPKVNAEPFEDYGIIVYECVTDYDELVIFRIILSTDSDEVLVSKCNYSLIDNDKEIIKSKNADEIYNLVDDLFVDDQVVMNEKDMNDFVSNIFDNHSIENSDKLTDSMTESDDAWAESILEDWAGEYVYTTDYGVGKLIIQKSEWGYDISDYKEDSSYRFLANSSNINIVSEKEIAMKYPAHVYSDGTAIFEYYTFKLDTDKIEVGFSESENDEPKYLYSAIRKI